MVRKFSGGGRAAAVAAGLMAAVSAARGVTYSVTPLGTLGGIGSGPSGINASGVVVGSSSVAGSNNGHAFLYDGTMHDLGILAGDTSTGAYSVNDSGQVASTSSTDGTHSHAVRYSGGTNADLGSLGGTFSTGWGINASGKVVGYSTMSSGIGHAFMWDGTMHDLSTLGGQYSEALAINANGQITGDSQTTGNAANYAFLLSGATMTSIGALGGTYSIGAAINAGGKVVGYADTAFNAANHAFMYDGTIHDLGTLGGRNSVAKGINTGGLIVGNASVTGDTVTDAYLYDGTMHDLNSMLVAGSGWTITDAAGINDNGWIAATGRNPSVNGGLAEAVLLTPVPEPGTVGLLGVGAGILLGRRRRR